MSKGNYYSGSPMGTRLGGDGCCVATILIASMFILIACGGTKKLNKKENTQQKQEQPQAQKQKSKGITFILFGSDSVLKPDTIIYNDLAQTTK